VSPSPCRDRPQRAGRRGAVLARRRRQRAAVLLGSDPARSGIRRAGGRDAGRAGESLPREPRPGDRRRRGHAGRRRAHDDLRDRHGLLRRGQPGLRRALPRGSAGAGDHRSQGASARRAGGDRRHRRAARL
ncbi:MAG: RidA/YER057c/UK114 superfamily protein, partial [uncultured Solirubrobacteraceae bacterium]